MSDEETVRDIFKDPNEYTDAALYGLSQAEERMAEQIRLETGEDTVPLAKTKALMLEIVSQAAVAFKQADDGMKHEFTRDKT